VGALAGCQLEGLPRKGWHHKSKEDGGVLKQIVADVTLVGRQKLHPRNNQ
jgi:hypothetical protein